MPHVNVKIFGMALIVVPATLPDVIHPRGQSLIQPLAINAHVIILGQKYPIVLHVDGVVMDTVL